MNVNGILRKSSPTNKRSSTMNIPDNLNFNKTIQVINHNEHNSNDPSEHREKYKLMENKYSVPIFNTILNLSHKCKNLKELNIRSVQNLNDLTPQTKTVITRKVRIISLSENSKI